MSSKKAYFLAALAAFAVSTPLRADKVDDALNAAIALEDETAALSCRNEGQGAEIIFLRRQNGESRSDILADTVPTGALDVRLAVKEAFSSADAQSQAALLTAASAFGQRFEKACIDRAK